MNATFTYAARYETEAVCVTPFRTGGPTGDKEELLRRKDGRLFLQGTSLTGALRSWLEEVHGKALGETLFGSQKQSGSLTVSDALFAQDAEEVIRPRLRIDAATGTAAEGGKFNVAHVAAGSRLTFTLTWLGSRDLAARELPQVEQLLAALQAGEICLGAQKTNGFGRVSLRVRKQTYDLLEASDREAWLSDAPGEQELKLPVLEAGDRVAFTVQVRLPRLLVKSEEREETETDSCVVNLTEKGCPVLPGSSLKGTVLTRVRAIAGLLQVPQAVLEQAFGRTNGEEDNGVAGQVRFEDAYLDKKQCRKQKITRIRVDRITGGVIRGGLFREEPVSGETTLRITAPADQPAACALLLYALRDLGLGLYNLGSGGAIGRGSPEVETITAETAGKTLTLRFGSGSCRLEDPAELWKTWTTALGGMRDEA